MDRSHCRAFSRTTAAVVSLLAWTAAVSSSAQDAAAVDEDRALGPEPAAELAPGNEAVSEAFRYEAHWQAKVDADLIDEAIDIATSWVNAATVQYGDDSAEAFVPTLRLAETHYINDDPAKSVAAYLDAIKVGERNFGAVSPLLVKPLQRLGQIYQQQDDDEAAISALMRAKDITHRNAGIFNIEQGPIVDLLTESFWSMGDIRQATREQRFLFGTAEKTYGDDNPNLVPALHKWARHNARIGRLSDSRQIYHRALEVMENTYGPNDLRLIDTLYRMANTLVPAGAGGQDNQYYPREGAIALSRAIDIYQAQEFVDNEDVLTAQARLGDWYMRNDRRNRALDTYQSAIDQARASGIDEASIDRQFGAPRQLTAMNPTIGMSESARKRAREKTQRIIFEYDLDHRGQVRNVRVVEDTLGLVSTLKLMREQLKALKHRPRWVDGRAVPFKGMRVEVLYPANQDRPRQIGPYPVRPVEPASAKTGGDAETAASSN